MKVCAHMNLGPFIHNHYRFDSIATGISGFRRELIRHHGSTHGIQPFADGYDMPCVDFYPQCEDCNSQMNFHDYPMSRYQVGSRGGIRKVTV